MTGTKPSGCADLSWLGRSVRSVPSAAPSCLASPAGSLTWSGSTPTYTTGCSLTMGWPAPSRMDARAACWSVTVSRVLAASLGWTVLAVQATCQPPEPLASATVVAYFQVVLPSGQDTVTGAVALLPET